MNQLPGLHRAVVKSTTDPNRKGRVLVTVPSVSDEPKWAALCVPHGRNVVDLPEVGDEVIVAFANDDPRSPICLGSLWDGQSPPPSGSHRP